MGGSAVMKWPQISGLLYVEVACLSPWQMLLGNRFQIVCKHIIEISGLSSTFQKVRKKVLGESDSGAAAWFESRKALSNQSEKTIDKRYQRVIF
jgi:hypothetical protein